MSVVEVDPALALDAAVFTAVGTGHKRLGSVFHEVATQLPIEKREVKASLQRLRKAGRVKCDCATGHWSVVKKSESTMPTPEQITAARDLGTVAVKAMQPSPLRHVLETLLAAVEPETKAVNLDPLITDNMLLEAADFANTVAHFNSGPNDIELARDVMRGPPHSGRSTWHICVLGYITMRLRGDI